MNRDFSTYLVFTSDLLSMLLYYIIQQERKSGQMKQKWVFI